MNMPKTLLVIKSPPYGSIMASEGIRIATALIAMDILPQLVFVDDGVYCLVKNHKPEVAGLGSFYDRLKTLADLIGLCVAKNSLRKRNLEIEDIDKAYNAKAISLTEVARQITESDVAIAF
jgi:sulfur relay (sulfurtransferase) DsrF/TusC family protein